MIYKLIVIVLALIAVNSLWSGVNGVIHTRALQQRGVRGKGTVVGFRESAAKVPDYFPLVDFLAADGKHYQFETWSESKPEGNETMDVLYNADDPNVARSFPTTPLSISGSVWSLVWGILFLVPAVMIFSPARALLPDFRTVADNPEAVTRLMVGSAKWISVLLVGGAGVGFLIAGAVVSAKRAALSIRGVRTDGTVVEWVSTGKYSHPVIEFVTTDGQKHRFVAPTEGKDWKKPTMPIVYNPANPANASPSEWQQMWLAPIVMLGMGLLFSAFGVGIYRIFLSVAKEIGAG